MRATTLTICGALCLLGSSGPASGQDRLLLEDLEFEGWSTVPVLAHQFASEHRIPTGSATSSLTRSPDPAVSAFVTSHSVLEGGPSSSTTDPRDELLFSLFHLATDPAQTAELEPEFVFQPLLIQNGRKFVARDLDSGPLPSGGGFASLALTRDRFRALDGGVPLEPSFEPGARPVQLGIVYQTTSVPTLPAGHVLRVRWSHLTVSLRPAPPAGSSSSRRCRIPGGRAMHPLRVPGSFWFANFGARQNLFVHATIGTGAPAPEHEESTPGGPATSRLLLPSNPADRSVATSCCTLGGVRRLTGV